MEPKKAISSSKAGLKDVFSRSNFFKPTPGVGAKQVTVATARKLNFDTVAQPPIPLGKSKICEKENRKIKLSLSSSKENQNTKDLMNYIKTVLPNQDEDKESIKMVSRRLKEDLNEDKNSPSMLQYKNFSKQAEQWEELGLSKMITKVFQKICDLPKKIHWKIILDLADFAKRKNEFSKANTLYKIVTHLQPYAHQGWLDHAKMEEEFGNIDKCRTLLKRGLKFIPLNEKLFLKTLKIEEKEGNFSEVKKLIASLKAYKIEDTYKLLLEGILFEGRQGNIRTTQKALKFLYKKFPRNGKVFQKAAEFEEKIGNIEQAIRICEEGLNYNGAFGPLWFLLLKLAYKVDESFRFEFVKSREDLINQAVEWIYSKSSDLVSKLYLEAAQYQDGDNLKLSREYLRQALSSSNKAHKWKVWLIGARIEARIGSTDSAKSLVEKALKEIPPKKESIGYLEQAKYYEMISRVDLAEKILKQARDKFEDDWKVFFESVICLVRNGQFEKAEKLVKDALKTHGINGRLWATLIQLRHAKVKTVEDSKKAFSVFLKANSRIPKSGEVWCEGGRL